MYPYICSGILLGVGFVFPILWIAGVFGIAVFIWQLTKDANFRNALIGGFMTWYIKFLFVLGFYWTMYPIQWLPFDFGYGELGLIGLYWVTVALFLALGGVVFVVLFKILQAVSLTSEYIAYFVVPLLWLVSEISGSISLSLFTIGPGSDLNTHFSLGYVGLLFAEHPWLLQIAQVAGVYSLSFAIVVFSLFVMRVFATNNTKSIIAVSVFVFILWVSGFIVVFEQVKNKTLTTVAVVSTEYPVQELFDRDKLSGLKEQQQRSLRAALDTGAEYIIFPEDSRIFDQKNGIEKEKAIFNFLHADADSIIIDSGKVNLAENSVLQGFIYDSDTEEHATVHKRYLVPQGEFVPYIYEWFFRLIGFNELMDSVTNVVSYKIGPDTDQSQLDDDYPGVLFCFESASATGVRSLVGERPDLPFVAHPVSHSWFNIPESFWSQLDSALKVQAVWNQIPIVSAGNHAPSQLFLPDGSVVQPETVTSEAYWSVGIVYVPVR